MGQKNKKRLNLATFLILTMATLLPAQISSGQTDSLVRLMNATSLEQADRNGELCRKAVNATFLHNGTYLICDSSFWNVDEKIINCIGHVQLVQGESILTSDKLDYFIDENLAQFRGELVQLRNKQDNILRTHFLDYNTLDSTAVFSNGAAMKSKDGQVIESEEGIYYNSRSFFRFKGNVDMFSDSVFVKTDSLNYDSKAGKAIFVTYIDFWKDDNMLSARKGWYDNRKDVFFFNNDVHATTRDQECWSDSLYYYRKPNDILMLGNVHVQDTTRNAAAMADYLMYRDSVSSVTMKNRAALAMWSKQKDKLDTLYCGAKTFVFRTVRKCDIDSSEVSSAESRLKEISGDPVAEYRARAAQEAAAAAEEARKNDPNFASQQLKAPAKGTSPAGKSASGGARSALKPVADASLSKGSSKGALSPEGSAKSAAGLVADTVPGADVDSMAAGGTAKLAGAASAAVKDTAKIKEKPAVKDTSRVGFLSAIKDVKIFRSDIQASCDSLVFNELDSIGRMYKEPVVWSDSLRQYSSDSLFVLVKKNGIDRASLMSDAFIAIKENKICFDQIKSAEVMAYFDSTAALRRFDALGGADALFFLKEKDTLATVNKVQSQMLSALLKKGDLDKVYYFESPKNDAYPVAQLSSEEQHLKGFSWQPGRRPGKKTDVTTLEIKPSERSFYARRPRTVFRQADIYFPGYMKSVYKGINDAKERREAARAKSAAEKKAASDSLHRADSLLAADSTKLASGDSLMLKKQAPGGSTAPAVKDAKTVKGAQEGAKEEKYMTPGEQRRAMRIARRDARWAALDSLDAARAAGKKADKESARQKKAEAAALRQARQDAIDSTKLQRYIEYYQKQKDRNERRRKEHQSKPSGERTQGTQTGGEVQTPSGV